MQAGLALNQSVVGADAAPRQANRHFPTLAIAKHCRKLGVPVPERGYSNKVQAGSGVDA
jgi:hypothetical protein